MRTEAGIRHLARVSLVHQVHIDRGFEDAGRQFHLRELLAFHVENIYFHGYCSRFLRAYCLRASLIMTRLPFAAGNRAMNAEQVALRIHQDDLEILSGDTVHAHMTRAAGALVDTTRGGTGATANRAHDCDRRCHAWRSCHGSGSV